MAVYLRLPTLLDPSGLRGGVSNGSGPLERALPSASHIGFGGVLGVVGVVFLVAGDHHRAAEKNDGEHCKDFFHCIIV